MTHNHAKAVRTVYPDGTISPSVYVDAYVCGPTHHLWTRWYRLRSLGEATESYRYCRNCGKQNRRIMVAANRIY